MAGEGDLEGDTVVIARASKEDVLAIVHRYHYAKVMPRLTKIGTRVIKISNTSSYHGWCPAHASACEIVGQKRACGAA